MNRHLEENLSDPANQLPIIAVDIPIMYEDEGQDEVGETDIHWRCCEILRNGMIAFFGKGSPYRVFSDLNVYYHPVDRWAYVTPDACAVIPYEPLPENVTSYRIGTQGPAPVIAMEVLSHRSAQQQDLTNKPTIYSRLGVSEYIVIDVTGHFFPKKLLIKTLQQEDDTWIDHQDADGGVTSKLGFRIIIDDDGMIRLVNAKTGIRYPRPEETGDIQFALSQSEELRKLEQLKFEKAEKRIQELEAQLRKNQAGQ